jgi:hypothetical protein
MLIEEDSFLKKVPHGWLSGRASTIWPIPFRKRACIKLKGILKEFEGVIRLARRPRDWNRHENLRLRIGNTPFTSTISNSARDRISCL